MEKKAFVTKEMIEKIVEKYPTPFHIYDEKGIRENAKALKEAFAWNKGYKEFFSQSDIIRHKITWRNNAFDGISQIDNLPVIGH